MRCRQPTIIVCAAIGSALLWHAQSGAQVLLATGPDAEVAEDGLQRVDPSIMGVAWVRPDLDLSRYNRIYFMPTVVQFRDVPERRYILGPADDEDSFFVPESRKARLRELFGEAFYEAVGRVKSYELADEVGRDVLVVRGLLTDVISGTPPDVVGNSGFIGTDWVWEANIVLELRDGMSDVVLARTADSQRARCGNGNDRSCPPDAESAFTPRLIQSWSELLVERLEELSDLSSE